MPVLRPASADLQALLKSGQHLWMADLFDFTLIDGVTKYLWTSFDSDIAYDGYTWGSRKPWLSRSKWNVTNTMTVPSLLVYLRALDNGFNNGTNIKLQIHNGLFDGATFVLTRVFMTEPGVAGTDYGVMLFSGIVGGIDIIGTRAEITVKGKNNLLDQYSPRNMIQTTCNHAFCDAGCTLSRATFTEAFTMGSGATTDFLPWAGGDVPGSPQLFIGGSVQITSGPATGQWRTVLNADSTGLSLAYPLYEAPTSGGGDTFSAFEGCDKTFDSGSGRSCTDRSNTQHYRGFEFVPPPTAAY